MLSTLLQDEIFLGYPATAPLANPTHEHTFLGGRPVFLRMPNKEQLVCSNCPHQTLTFICQVFCPFETEQCYNRVLYMFYCEKCQRQFRCIKQQASKKQEIVYPKVEIRVIDQRSLEVESQSIEVKQLIKIKNKAKALVDEEIKQEDEQFDSQGQQIEIKQIQINLEQLGLTKQIDFSEQIGQQKLQGLKMASENMEQAKKQQKDIVFQQYRKIMSELDDPVLLYSNIPIPYNSQPINPKHFCKFCKEKLNLQLQITQKLLLLSPKLVGQDWGSLLVFTCSNSCQKSISQCVVVQYESDAVQDTDVKMLNKRQKQRKRKEKSSKKKEQKSGTKQEKSPPKFEQKKESDEQGDWD